MRRLGPTFSWVSVRRPTSKNSPTQTEGRSHDYCGQGLHAHVRKCRHRRDGQHQGERVRSALDVNPDGTTTVTSTGHNGLILFPTDVPAAPSTTQYVGRIVYTVDESGVFTLVSTSGRSTDICAALAP